MDAASARAAGAPAIVPLLAADHAGALALVAESGWNQVAADWQMFTELGAAFAVKDEAGQVMATAAILPFTRFGWISMVLVSKARRRQGLAARLLQRCIDRLRQQELVPVLDATPAGRSVYQPLGFRDGWAITRWRRPGPAPVPHLAATGDAAVRALSEDDWPQIDALDAQSFGAPRGAVLRRLHARSGGFACVAESGGRIRGFLLGRDGRQATHVGPIVALDGAVAGALLAHALHHVQGAVLVDALEAHAGLRPQLARAGFAVERGYTRMALDADPLLGDARTMFAIAGPELG